MLLHEVTLKGFAKYNDLTIPPLDDQLHNIAYTAEFLFCCAIHLQPLDTVAAIEILVIAIAKSLHFVCNSGLNQKLFCGGLQMCTTIAEWLQNTAT